MAIPRSPLRAWSGHPVIKLVRNGKVSESLVDEKVRTSFTVRNVDVKKTKEEVSVTVEVKNTGKLSGAEVIQAYVKDHTSALPRPDKELKTFEKVFLAPNETKQIKLTLPKKAFEYYDPVRKSWTLEPGKFSVLIGNSSRNIMTEATIEW